MMHLLEDIGEDKLGEDGTFNDTRLWPQTSILIVIEQITYNDIMLGLSVASTSVRL